MELVIRAAIEAIDDLRAPGMMKLFFSCIGITALVSVLMLAGGIAAIDIFLTPNLPTEEEVASGFLAGLIQFFAWSIAISTFIIPLFLLFWSLMIFIASFFDEYIAEKIENFRYPALAKGTNHPFWQEMRYDIRFSIKMLLLNMVVLFPMLIIPLFWPLLPIVFPTMNGYMLGRYFFQMAGGRHIGRKAADALGKQHRGKLLAAGLLMVLASTVPLLNLLVPFWGVAMMVHLYHLIDKPQHTPSLTLPLKVEGT